MTVEAIKSGIDLSYLDTAARAQDDLFGHVNGRWLTEYEIPADRAADGAFRTLYDRAEEQIRDLITEAAESNAEEGTDEQRIGDLARVLPVAPEEERGSGPRHRCDRVQLRLRHGQHTADGVEDRRHLSEVLGGGEPPGRQRADSPTDDDRRIGHRADHRGARG